MENEDHKFSGNSVQTDFGKEATHSPFINSFGTFVKHNMFNVSLFSVINKLSHIMKL